MEKLSEVLAEMFSWTRKYPAQWILCTVILWIFALGWERDGMRSSMFLAAILMTLGLIFSMVYAQWRQSRRFRREMVVIFLIDVSKSMSNLWPKVDEIVRRQLDTLEKPVVGLWRFGGTTIEVLEPAHRSPKDIRSALIPLQELKTADGNLEVVVNQLVPKFEPYQASMPRQLVVVTDAPVRQKLRTAALALPETSDINVTSYDVRTWEPKREPEVMLLPSKEKKTRRAVLPWVLVMLLLLTSFRCPIGRMLGFSEEYHRTFSEVLPVTIDALRDGVGAGDILSGGRTRSIEALREAYLGAMADESSLASVHEELRSIKFDSPTEVTPWLADRLPANWLVLSEDVIAGWLDCCAHAHVVLARTGLLQPSGSEEVVVDLIFRELSGHYDFLNEEVKIEGEEISAPVAVTSAELEKIVQNALGDKETLRQRLAAAGFSGAEVDDFDYLWTEDRERIENFESGDFRPSGPVYLGLLAISKHLQDQLRKHPVLALEVVAVGFADRDTLSYKAIDPQYALIPYVPDPEGCPPNRNALGNRPVAPGAFATIPYAPLGTTAWPTSSKKFPEPIFKDPVSIVVNSGLKDNCKLSYLRGYEGIRILSEKVTKALDLSVDDPRFRFGYSGKGTTNFSESDGKKKYLDRKVTFYIRLFQATPSE